VAKVPVRSLIDVRTYLREMYIGGRAGDDYPRIRHAQRVHNTVLALLGPLVMTADSESIEVNMTAPDRRANMCWFTVNHQPYYLGYDHVGVVLRERSREGRTLYSFNDQTPPATIAMAFASLGTPVEQSAAA
jgi:hypothetical protein